MSDFGNKFRSARESKGIKLEQIAQETCISERFLRAIEEEDFQVLPGGIFNRGFIRTFAERVGLDPEAAVAEYKELTATVDAEESGLFTGSVLDAAESHVLPIAVGAMIVAILLFYVFTRDAGTSTEAAEQQAIETQVLAEAEPSPAPVVAAVTPSPTSGVPREIIGNEKTDDTNGLSVQIEVHKTTWISVQSDGEEVAEGMFLDAGTNRRYTASKELELWIGNAAGVTLSINDREVPTLGSSGQVRILTITPDNVERFTGS